ncbi:MAG: dimethyl sulfoxide reductase anchor subunit [Alphaproteobacteria bacterium]|nr:dimethyl sulfoxide reductase anchor subunit [Alphaproteobacteria bacterium]
MHPALSIIVFTTVSGLGYGLAVALGLGLLDPMATATRVAHVLALGLIAAGLASSTLHLGNPQRAWRAFSQWRSSWLSREGVMAVITFLPLAASAWLALFEGRYVPALGLAGAALSLATVYCTAMIYASLKSVQTWHTPLTPLCYLLFSLAGGFALATMFAAAGGGTVTLPAVLALIFLAAAWAAKLAWRNRMNRLRPISTPETATGLGFIGKVRLFERPHINDNYLTREMGFRVARKHAAKLAMLSLGLGGLVPATLLVGLLAAGPAQGAAVAVALLAVASHATGMLVERWLFFAEARHAVMNYYGG